MADLAFGFKVKNYKFFKNNINYIVKMLSFLPWVLLYVRIRDKTLDPDFKETYI